VPAIAISPWLPKNVNSTLFEHSSFAATVKEFFNLTSPFLNNRDASSNVFLSESILLEEKREDCPKTLPEVFPSFEEVPRV
jgi:hypothetical protein